MIRRCAPLVVLAVWLAAICWCSAGCERQPEHRNIAWTREQAYACGVWDALCEFKGCPSELEVENHKACGALLLDLGLLDEVTRRFKASAARAFEAQRPSDRDPEL